MKTISPKITAVAALLSLACAATYLACKPSEPSSRKVDHFALGQLLYQDQLWERAADELRLDVEQNPEHVEAHTLLGLCCAKLDRVDEAIAHLEVPASREVPRADVYYNLSKLYQKKGLYEQSLACALKAKKLDPDSLNLGNTLGLAYFGQGKYDKAVAEYTRILEKEDKAWVRNNLGLLYIEMGENQKARTQLLRALELDPKNAKAHNNLGVVLQRMDRYREAREQFAEAVRLDPAYSRAKFNLQKIDLKLSSLEFSGE